MPKFSFKPEELKKAVALARIVKSETGDLCFKFSEDCLTIFAFDKRRYVCSRIRPETSEKVPDGYESDDYYVTLDRVALFDSDLVSVSISTNEKSLSIRASDGDQVRNASLKKRSFKSRRPNVPSLPDVEFVDIEVKPFESLLKQVSCSAMINETKTEEDMRVHQVHFYPDSSCACSDARYYGTVAYLDDMKVDLSIIGSDVPSVKSFCSKISGEKLSIGQDDKRVYFLDPETNSIVTFSKVPSRRPPLSVLDSDGFKTVVVVDQNQLNKSLAWAHLAIEGTQRVTVSATSTSESGDGELEFSSGSQEISKFPVKFAKGKSLKADFPVRFFHHIVRHVSGDVALGFDHTDAPTILGIFNSESNPEDKVKYTHFLTSMKSR